MENFSFISFSFRWRLKFSICAMLKGWRENWNFQEGRDDEERLRIETETGIKLAFMLNPVWRNWMAIMKSRDTSSSPIVTLFNEALHKFDPFCRRTTHWWSVWRCILNNGKKSIIIKVNESFSFHEDKLSTNDNCKLEEKRLLTRTAERKGEVSIVIAAKSKQQLKQKVFCSKTSCSCTASHVQVEGGKSKVNVPFYGRLSTLMLFNYYLQWFLMLCKMLMRADAMCMHTAQTRTRVSFCKFCIFSFLIHLCRC